MSRIVKVSENNYKLQVQTGGVITLDTGNQTGRVVVTGDLAVLGNTTTVESETLNSFGWKPIVDFAEGINETINWLLGKSENPMELLNSSRIKFNLPIRRKIH